MRTLEGLTSSVDNRMATADRATHAFNTEPRNVIEEVEVVPVLVPLVCKPNATGAVDAQFGADFIDCPTLRGRCDVDCEYVASILTAGNAQRAEEIRLKVLKFLDQLAPVIAVADIVELESNARRPYSYRGVETFQPKCLCGELSYL